jgi:hypothetical protein
VSRGLLNGLDDCPVWAILGETMRAEEDGSFVAWICLLNGCLTAATKSPIQLLPMEIGTSIPTRRPFLPKRTDALLTPGCFLPAEGLDWRM